MVAHIGPTGPAHIGLTGWPTLDLQGWPTLDLQVWLTLELQGGPRWTYRVGPRWTYRGGLRYKQRLASSRFKYVLLLLWDLKESTMFYLSKLLFDKFALIALGKKISDQRFKPKKKFWLIYFLRENIVKSLITNTSKEFIKCCILHFLIMECCRYLVV